MISFNDLKNPNNLYCFHLIKNGKVIGNDYKNIFKLNYILPIKIDNKTIIQLISIYDNLTVFTDLFSINLCDKFVSFQLSFDI